MPGCPSSPVSLNRQMSPQARADMNLDDKALCAATSRDIGKVIENKELSRPLMIYDKVDISSCMGPVERVSLTLKRQIIGWRRSVCRSTYSRLLQLVRSGHTKRRRDSSVLFFYYFGLTKIQGCCWRCRCSERSLFGLLEESG